MKLRSFALISIGLVVGGLSTHVSAQSVQQIVEKAERRAKELKAQEAGRYNAVLKSRDLKTHEAFVSDYPGSKNTPEVKRRINEIKLWNKAKTVNSLSSYQTYLSKSQYHWYDNDANQAINQLKRLSELTAWQKVKKVGTIAAYRDYLQKNPQSGYKQDAENEINRLQAKVVWQMMEGSRNQEEIQAFIKEYPNADELNTAKNLLCELKAMEFYYAGDLRSAYYEFIKIPHRVNVTDRNRDAYDKTMEFHEYAGLNAYSSETTVLAFINKYPKSQYIDQAYNYLAIAKARNLNSYSSKYHYDEARKYVKDSDTRSMVEGLITQNKRAQRKARRERDGGVVNLGLEFFNLGWSPCRGCREEFGRGGLLTYDVGLGLRLGNYANRVQFAVSLHPGFVAREGDKRFHLPLGAELKLNLCRVNEDYDSGRLYLSGQYIHNIVRDKLVESEDAWRAGFGFAWKHIDFLFYYKQDLDASAIHMSKKHNYIGSSLTYYFTF